MAEKKYIEREVAIAETRKPRLTDAELRRRLASIPAADVRPVVRGIWEKQDANFVCNDVGLYSAAYKCNRCGKLNIAETNYCPNCGADMRISYTNCKNTATTGEDREISNLRAMSKKESKVMGVYIPNLDEKKFYEICKEHNLDFIAIPAADVRPVVRGKWVDEPIKGIRYHCSVCQARFDYTWHYCPDCGADMREENDGT